MSTQIYTHQWSKDVSKIGTLKNLRLQCLHSSLIVRRCMSTCKLLAPVLFLEGEEDWQTHSTSICSPIQILLPHAWANLSGLIILAMNAGNIKALV